MKSFQRSLKIALSGTALYLILHYPFEGSVMHIPKLFRIWLLPVILISTGIGLYSTRDQWIPLVYSKSEESKSSTPENPRIEEPKVLKISSQARKNLGLISKPVKIQTYWKKVQIPGTIIDRPGRTDRGITAPAIGVVTQIHALPGDTVKPGDKLFTLRLISEYLQKTQKELYSSTREVQFLKNQLKRLKPLAENGGIAKSKVIDLENQLLKQTAALNSHSQDLMIRGLNSKQIKSIASGKFVSTIEILVPSTEKSLKTNSKIKQVSYNLLENNSTGLVYEVQDLSAELGQQVQAGQLLSKLANHKSLYIEGHAFKRDAPSLEKAAQNGWGTIVEFTEDSPKNWPALKQKFVIRHLSNSIDSSSRTFDFFIPLTNQAHSYERRNQIFIIWRFQPGQRVRLHVPVEKMDNVVVLPSTGVVREGPEAFVFQQNGDLFNRISVQVLHEDRLNIVLANDGSVTPGLYLAQNSAASLNRILKAQAASGMRADVHVHADGTVHAAH
jgi:membrane fusion protein, heavy metal efflux system